MKELGASLKVQNFPNLAFFTVRFAFINNRHLQTVDFTTDSTMNFSSVIVNGVVAVCVVLVALIVSSLNVVVRLNNVVLIVLVTSGFDTEDVTVTVPVV